MSANFHRFDNRAALAEALATDVAARIHESPTKTLAVTGGTTPAPFFAALKPKLAGVKLTVTLSDERWVDNTHADSNERLVREHLLTPAMRFIPLKTESVEATEQGLAALQLPFAAVVLGMGEDGHIASLFPHHPALAEGLKKDGARLSLPVHDAPKPPPERISLTLHALSQARAIYLHVTGEAKRDVLARAMNPGPVEELPVRAILRLHSLPVAVYWAP